MNTWNAMDYIPTETGWNEYIKSNVYTIEKSTYFLKANNATEWLDNLKRSVLKQQLHLQTGGAQRQWDGMIK